MDILTATIEAVENANRWMNGAVVLQEGSEFRAYPGAYLTDISFTTEYDEIAIDLRLGLDDTGYSLDEASAEEIAELLLQS